MPNDILLALPGALLRGVLTAVLVGALLLVALRWGRGAAGLLAGLPTVTGPALLWLALDRDTAFAVGAAAGAVAAGIACALFAVGYGLACRRQPAAMAVGLATAAAALPLPWLDQPHWPLALWLALASAAAVTGQGALSLLAAAQRAGAGRASAPVAASARARGGWLTTAAVSGLVSAVAAALAGALGPFWAGMLTSPPLLAAAVAVELHRRGNVGETLTFLRGYAAGLLGRGLFVATFGALVPAAGAASAFAVALLVSLVAGGVSAHRLGRPAATMLAREQERA